MSIDSYITEAIEKYTEEMMNKIKTLSGKHLFKVGDTCAKLCEINKIIFHRLVEKLIFLSKRARPDIQPKIKLLTNRV